MPPTSLIGRDRERAAVAGLLRCADVRLLTLTGAGGVGKTRLALAVAEDLLGELGDGAFFVDLGPIVDSSLVPSVVAGVLGVGETAGAPLVERLVEHLGDRSLLLVLDNFEQVLSAAPLLSELLAACPTLKLLVTSRAALHLSGEHEYPVPPLELPDPKHLPDLEALARYEAVTLFVQRARAARPDFAVTHDNAPAIAELCARLDGLPLAIELAAARVKLLAPQALLARLGRRLGLLTGGARDLPERQQTLRGTMDWSYDLLEPGERTLFARLAVFVGGCSLEAAEAVCGAGAGAGADVPPEVLDGLALLVDKSLLRQHERPDGEPRFGMLETIREYAAERLDASPDAEAVRRRHAEHFLALAEEGAPELFGRRQGAWLDRLELEHDNLRAALGWALECEEHVLAPRLVAALGYFWQMHGHLGEGAGWIERVLSRWPDAPAPALSAALNAAGNLHFIKADYDRAAAYLEESLRLRRELGDRRGIAQSLQNLARVVHYLGDLGRSVALHEEALVILRELGNARGVAVSLNGLGVIARNRGDYARARALQEESLAQFREVGDTASVGVLLNNLARVTRDLEDWPSTAAFCSESLVLFESVGDPNGVAWVLSNLVVVAQRRGACEWAAKLHGAAEALREAVDTAALSMSPAERDAYATAVAQTRATLGDAAYADAMAAGRATGPGDVAGAALAVLGSVDAGSVDAALATDGSRSTAPPPAARASSPLTRREREVARLVARGLTDRQISETLVITEGTVGVHLGNIFTKLDLHSRAQLATWVATHGA